MFKLVLKHFINELAISALFDALIRNFPIMNDSDLTDAEKYELTRILAESLYDYPNSIIDKGDIPFIIDMVLERTEIKKASIPQFITDLIYTINDKFFENNPEINQTMSGYPDPYNGEIGFIPSRKNYFDSNGNIVER